MKKEGQKISIDQLAQMINTGFADMGKRMDDGFKAVEGRLFNLEGDMSHVKTRLDRMEEKLTTGNYEGRLTSLEGDVAKVKARAGLR